MFCITLHNFKCRTEPKLCRCHSVNRFSSAFSLFFSHRQHTQESIDVNILWHNIIWYMKATRHQTKRSSFLHPAHWEEVDLWKEKLRLGICRQVTSQFVEESLRCVITNLHYSQINMSESNRHPAHADEEATERFTSASQKTTDSCLYIRGNTAHQPAPFCFSFWLFGTLEHPLTKTCGEKKAVTDNHQTVRLYLLDCCAPMKWHVFTQLTGIWRLGLHFSFC